MYNLEEYWGNVAKQLKGRSDNTEVLIAGDNEPYYNYKRKVFLKALHSLDFSAKHILEVGCGPGGNLKEIANAHTVAQLHGCDISQDMVDLSRSHLSHEIKITKTDGVNLPYPDKTFDTIFTSTVLQHITDDQMLSDLIDQIGLKSRDQIILFERIEKREKRHESNVGRTAQSYIQLLSNSDFEITKSKSLSTPISRMACGLVRKIFNASTRLEGEKVSQTTVFLQSILLIFTKPLDRVFAFLPGHRMLVFSRCS